MSSLTHPLPPSLAAPWSQVAAIYRRICLLRARGHDAEADRLQQYEFAEANAAAEIFDEENSVPSAPERFQALLAAEENRVADALLLAEVLAPIIAEQIRHLPSTATVAASASPVPAPRESIHPRPPRDLGEPTPGIADLIDSMLGQERGLRQPSR